MHVIIAIIWVLGAAGIIMYLSGVVMHGGIKAVIISVVVLLAVYGMARVPAKELKSKVTDKISQRTEDMPPHQQSESLNDSPRGIK